MKLFKRDTTKWEVRQVDGEPYPGEDSEGEKCYINTHFENESDAWDSLKSNVEAYVEMSARRIEDAKIELAKAEKQAAEAACAIAKVLKAMPANPTAKRRSASA